MLVGSEKGFWQYNFFLRPLRVHGLLFVCYILLGFALASPHEIYEGMLVIFTSANILVTDYILIAGLGPTLVNVGVMGLLTIMVLVWADQRPHGLDMGILGLSTGFAFFGKNPLNMIPILIGSLLYCKFAKQTLLQNITPALLGNALAPAVSQLAHIYTIPTPVGVALGALMGVFIGFTISPLSAWFRRAHEGLNLYNVGFTAGVFAIALMALYANLGITFEPRAYWSHGNNFTMSLFLLAVSTYFLVVGLLADTGERVSLRELWHVETKDLDYYKWFRERSYVAMAMLGYACFLLMLVMRAEYTGLAVGAILSVIGFGAFGKSLKHAVPIVVGTLLADFANYLSFGDALNSNASMVAILFSTCLTPVAKRFGWKWGVLAGYLHLSLSTNIAIFHGGMNLYNNGLAAGLVAMLLLPIMRTFESRREARLLEASGKAGRMDDADELGKMAEK